MPGLLRELKSRGYALYGITGRPAAQEADTIANLNEQGFTVNGLPAGTPLFTAATMYTKDPVVAGTSGVDPDPALGQLRCRREHRRAARRSSTRR